MGILDESAALAEERLGRAAGKLTIERLTIGLFFTGVKLSNGASGVCFTPVKEIPDAVCCPSSAARSFDPVRIPGTEVRSALAALDSPEPIKTAVAIATLNALSAACWERGLTGGLRVQEGVDGQDKIHMPQDASVAVVGAFGPVLAKLRARGGEWWIIEQDPRTLREDERAHFVPADQSSETIRHADVLVVTGVTLINHTLEGILSAAAPGAEIAVGNAFLLKAELGKADAGHDH